MANIKHICPECEIGTLKCHNTSKTKRIGKHTLTWATTSSWECTHCNTYFKRYTPVSELIKVVKRFITRKKNRSTTDSKK